jgi:CP family cyanate transporter-like MFS transporter
MGVYAMSLGLGSTVAAAFAHPLAALGDGWRFGSGLFAFPCVVAIIAWLIVARHQREEQAGSMSASEAGGGKPVRNGAAWLLALYASLNNFLFFGLIAWSAPMFRKNEMSDTAAGAVLASFTAAFMIGNPVAPLLTKSDDRRMTVAFFAALAAIGSLAEAASPGRLPFLFVPVVAFGVGGTFTLTMVLPLDNARNAREANSWTGFIMGLGYFIGSLGPLSIELLPDITGSFATPSPC